MGRLILVADDSTTIQKVIKIAFARYPLEIVEAATFIEALAVTTRQRPAALIIDASLPGAKGPADFAKLRQEAGEAPVLLLIGTYEAVDEAAFRHAGFQQILRKPFDTADVTACLEGLLGPLEASPVAEPPAGNLSQPPAPLPPSSSRPAAVTQPAWAPDTSQSSWPSQPAAPLPTAQESVWTSHPPAPLASSRGGGNEQSPWSSRPAQPLPATSFATGEDRSRASRPSTSSPPLSSNPSPAADHRPAPAWASQPPQPLPRGPAADSQTMPSWPGDGMPPLPPSGRGSSGEAPPWADPLPPPPPPPLPRGPGDAPWTAHPPLPPPPSRSTAGDEDPLPWSTPGSNAVHFEPSATTQALGAAPLLTDAAQRGRRAFAASSVTLDDLAPLVRQAVEDYCERHFKSLAREIIAAELRRLADDKARHLVDN